MSTNSDDFSKLIQDHHQAIESEFNMVRAGDIDSMADMARQQLATKLLTFVNVISEIALHGDTDAVRLAASKFGIQFVLGKDASIDPNTISPVQKLIEQLTRSDDDEPQS